MADDIDELEAQMLALRARVREAMVAGDLPAATALLGHLRTLDDAWIGAVKALVPAGSTAMQPVSGRALLPLRDQVHSALTLLTVPASPRLITQVYNACFAGDMDNAKLTSLRRDEERSFRTAPLTRPYYLCAALSADGLGSVRGLVALSTWPIERRVVGPLSPRVDFLTAAIKIAEHIERLPKADPVTTRLLALFADNIPGASGASGSASSDMVIRAAQAELEAHAHLDRTDREAAAGRARQLDDFSRLFGKADGAPSSGAERIARGYPGRAEAAASAQGKAAVKAAPARTGRTSAANRGEPSR